MTGLALMQARLAKNTCPIRNDIRASYAPAAKPPQLQEKCRAECRDFGWRACDFAFWLLCAEAARLVLTEIASWGAAG
jgi:hypothetical protein